MWRLPPVQRSRERCSGPRGPPRTVAAGSSCPCLPPSSSCLILREPRTESHCLQVSPSGGGCGAPRDHVWYPSRCSLAPGALCETDPLWSRQRAGAHRLREDSHTPAPAAAPLTYKGRISSEEKNGSLAAAFPSLLQQQIGRSGEFWCLENWILNRERLWTPSHPK